MGKKLKFWNPNDKESNKQSEREREREDMMQNGSLKG